MALALTLGGVDRTQYLKFDTCQIKSQLNARSSCDMELEENNRGYAPTIGMSVILTDGATRRFAGSIDQITESEHPGTGSRKYSVQCLDYNQICDRRLVTWTFTGDPPLTLKAIVEFIVDHFLDGEGITTAGVATGPTIDTPLNFNYSSATEVFNKLSSISGYGWYIDFNKDLKFSQFTSTAAPISLSPTSANWRNLSVTRDRGSYRNRQYARTEFEVAATHSQSFVGNGSSRAFFTDLAMTSSPIVTRNGASQTVGVLGVDAPGTKDWFYIPYSNSIQNFAPSPVLGGADTLAVLYEGPYSNVALVQDTAEIAVRAAAEGGSGKYESVREERNITSFDTLQAIANGELVSNGSIITEITFETDAQGLEPGQKININLPLHSLNDDFLIESVDYNWKGVRGGATDFLRTGVKCSDRTIVVQSARPTQVLERLVEVARIGADPTQTTESSSIPLPEEAPNNVTAGTWTHRYHAEETDNPTLELEGTITPPTPTGSFKGVVIYAEDPDQSAAGAFKLDGSTPLNGTSNVGGAWAPQLVARRPYVAGERIRLPFPVKKGETRNIRLRFVSYSDSATNELSKTLTPSILVTVPPPSRKPVGTEYADCVTGFSVAVTVDAAKTGISKTKITATYAKPEKRPPTGIWIYVEKTDGTREPIGPIWASGQSVEIDTPDPAVEAFFWGPSFVDPHATPDPADDAVNSIVLGVTPRFPASGVLDLGSAAGVIDLAKSKVASIGPALAVVNAVLGVQTGGITESLIGTFAVSESKLAAAAVSTSKIADLSIVTSKLADAVVDNSKLAVLAVGAANLAAGSVTSSKIADLAVEAAKLANSSVTTTKIANAAVGSAAIANAAVGSAAIANLAVGTAHIADAGITNAKIAALAVSAANIQDAAITTAKIQNLAVTNALIANLAVTDAKINDLSANKISAGTITATITINTPTINGGAISGATLSLNLNGFTTVINNTSDVGLGSTPGIKCSSNSTSNKAGLSAFGLTVVGNSGGFRGGLVTNNDSASISLLAAGVTVFQVNMDVSNFCETRYGYSVNGVQVIGPRLITVSAPTGGSTVDNEARIAIGTIISRLLTHGLIG